MKRILCSMFLTAICFLNTVEGASVISVRVEEECPNSVTLSWIGSATKGFNVYRAPLLFGTKTFIVSVDFLTKRATDVTAQPGQTYYYYVEAVDTYDSYMSTLSATARVPDELRKPFLPSASLLSSGIEVSWTYIGNEDGIKIYRSTDFGQYYLVKTIASAFTSSWTDYSVEPGKSYSYKITAYDNCGESAASLSSIYVTVPSLPDLVTDSLTVTVRKDSLYGRFIVANRGDKTAIPSFDVGVLCNDSLVATWETDGNLLDGWYLIFNFRYKIPDSRNILNICADFNEEVKESSGLNNCLKDTIHAIPLSIEHVSEPNEHERIGQIELIGRRLKINVNGDYKIQLYSTDGRLVFATSGNQPKTVNLNALATGQYVSVVRNRMSVNSTMLNIVR